MICSAARRQPPRSLNIGTNCNCVCQNTASLKKRNQTMTVIDTHSHWFPPEWVDLIEKEGAANGAKIGRNERGRVPFHVPGMSYVFKPEYTVLDIRFRAMDE